MKNYKKSSSLKDLEKLSLELKKVQYPNNPYPVGDIFRDDTANELTRAIIAYIRLKGGQAERISTTGRPIVQTKSFTDVIGRTRVIGNSYWIKGTGVKGSADLSATIAGRSVKIEVKKGTDRQSQAQKDYQKQVETAFGIYYIAKDFESFVTWFNLIFEKP